MGSNNLKDLMEAYNSIYAPQEVDEGLGSAVKKLFSGKKKEEAPKPMSRGEQLRKKYKVGPERSDTSAKKQILDRTRAKAERDQKQYGGSVYTKRVADKSKAAHDRYLKGGYSKYGADDRRGSGNKARKRAAALNREEFDIFDVVLEFLQAEGFAETLEQAEWMMANMIDEEAIDIILGEDSRRTSNKQHTARVKANIKSFGSNYTPPSNYDPDANRGQGEVVTRKQMEKKRRKSLRQEEVEQIDEMPYQVYGSPDGKNEKKIGKPVKSRKYADARAAELADTHKATGGKYRSQKEEYVDEAQAARNNPEKYEREQAKKSAPVRGERTPMPPRGDKRREDFEKWYAKNVR